MFFSAIYRLRLYVHFLPFFLFCCNSFILFPTQEHSHFTVIFLKYNLFKIIFLRLYHLYIYNHLFEHFFVSPIFIFLMQYFITSRWTFFSMIIVSLHLSTDTILPSTYPRSILLSCV